MAVSAKPQCTTGVTCGGKRVKLLPKECSMLWKCDEYEYIKPKVTF